MSPKVEQIFTRYARGLALTGSVPLLFKKRAGSIIDELRRLGWLIDDHALIGSCTRGTAIRPLEDNNIDLLVILNGHRYLHLQNPEGVHHVMRVFYEHLHYSFPKLPITQTPHEIRLDFPEYRVDVTPALRWHTGSFLIPDTLEETWRFTDPRWFANQVADLNENHNGAFVPLIHTVKAWNQRVGYPLQGFHLESMLVRRYDGTGRLGGMIQSFPAAVSDFFLALPSMLHRPSVDPYYNQRVDRYLGEIGYSKRWKQAVEKAEIAAGHAGAAYELYSEGHALQALGHWAELFGPELLIPARAA